MESARAGTEPEQNRPASDARTSPRGPSANDYWQEVGRRLARGPNRPLWRMCCDSLNRRWLERQLREDRFEAALKTDMFDEAAGEGMFPFLSARTDRVFGIDVAAVTCRLARNRYFDLATAACDVRDLPFGGGAFDLILSLSTLDHFAAVSDIEKALKSLYEALRPGGCLLITLDNLCNPAVRIRNSIRWRMLAKTGLVPYRVGQTLRPGELRNALEHAGFQVQSAGTLVHVPRVLAVALSKLLDGIAGQRAKQFFCRAVLAFEHLSMWPTANWTGHYTAVKAVRPGGADHH